MDHETLLSLTAEIVASHVSNNRVSGTDLPGVVQSVYAALSQLGEPAKADEAALPPPAVSVRSSVKPDAITCLECGRKFSSLKRHLGSDHGQTPDEYRSRWNLSSDYPMVSPNYAAKRADLARSIGLGRKPGEKRAAAAKPAGVRKPKAEAAIPPISD
jgi:predicted transcriptional regulator